MTGRRTGRGIVGLPHRYLRLRPRRVPALLLRGARIRGGGQPRGRRGVRRPHGGGGRAPRSRMIARGVTLELSTTSPGSTGSASRRPMNQLGLTHLSLRVDDVGRWRPPSSPSGARWCDPPGPRFDFGGTAARLPLLHRSRRGAHRVDGPRWLTAAPGGATGPGPDAPSATVSTVSSQPVDVTDIDPAEADRLVEAGAFMLDVREDDEWEAGHAPVAVHMPMGLVVERVDEIPTDRTVVCVCRVGGRSGSVATALAEAGFDVHNIAGGMPAWETSASRWSTHPAPPAGSSEPGHGPDRGDRLPRRLAPAGPARAGRRPVVAPGGRHRRGAPRLRRPAGHAARRGSSTSPGGPTRPTTTFPSGPGPTPWPTAPSR